MNRRALLVATGVLALGSMATACRDKDTPMSARTTAESLDELTRELKLTFPPSARLIGVLRENGMDDRVRVKVEMSAADLPAFLERTPIDADSFSPGAGGRLGQDHGFWDPHRAAKLRTAQATLDDNRVLNIGVDESRTDRVAVYIVNHGM